MNPNQPPAGPKDYEALAIAEVNDTVRGDKRTTTWAGAIHAYAVRSTAEALRLRDENAALREQVAKVRRETIEECAKKAHARVTFLGPLTQETLRDEYRHAAYFIHTSETGSLDKVVLEALSCGCPVLTRDPYLKDLPLNPPDPQFVRTYHSLQALIPKILAFYA